ncbi:MAG TPA: hypothetical protein VN651_05475 [Gemmatimonadaceae bacterium]|nr:hypothetical protein [Gemmatimonadaceae bacterium]
MNEHLRDRVLRKLETLSDERGYQVLDYVEFLESRYAERQSPSAGAFTRFTEAIEDKLRAGKVSASAIAETVGFMNRAASVLNNAVETGKNMASDMVSSVRSSSTSSSSTTNSTGSTAAAPSSPAPPPSSESSASSPAHETKAPGSGGEKL